MRPARCSSAGPKRMHKDLNRKGSHMLESRMRAKDALQINKDSVISVASYTVNLQHMHKPLKSVSSPHPHSALTLPWHPGLSSVPFHIASPTPGWFHHSFTSAATHTHTHTHTMHLQANHIDRTWLRTGFFFYTATPAPSAQSRKLRSTRSLHGLC